MRIFSVTLWHHLTYMVITVALLGFGAAGAWVAIRGAGDNELARRTAGCSAIGFTLTTILGFAVVLRIPLDTHMANSVLKLGFIFTYYLFLLPPFFFAGLGITVLMVQYVSLVHRLYFWNLVGSGLGCFLFLCLLTTVGGDYSISLICALAAASAVPIFRERRQRGISIAMAAACLLLLPATKLLFPVTPAPTKILGRIIRRTPHLETISIEWNPAGRSDMVTSPEIRKAAPGGVPVNKIIAIDGDTLTLAYDADAPWETFQVAK